jgi:hypothetical protein
MRAKENGASVGIERGRNLMALSTTPYITGILFLHNESHLKPRL